MLTLGFKALSVKVPGDTLIKGLLASVMPKAGVNTTVNTLGSRVGVKLVSVPTELLFTLATVTLACVNPTGTSEKVKV